VERCRNIKEIEHDPAILVSFHVGAKIVSWSGECRFMEGGPDVVVCGEGVCGVGEFGQRIEATEGLLVVKMVLDF